MIDVRILGPLEVLSADRVLALGGRKQRAVLAMLALQLNEVVSTDHLIDGLWAEGSPPSATNVLQAYISRLRKILGTESMATSVLQRQHPGYVLALPPENSDLLRFELLLRRGGAELDTDPRSASDTLAAALALWRGSPLAEFATEPFAVGEARRLEELYLIAANSRVQADLALGRHAEVIAELESLVSRYPLHEGLRGQLMLSLFRSGRQAEALSGYREFQRTLADELGIDPGQTLRDLESAILNSDPVLMWQPTPQLHDSNGLPDSLDWRSSTGALSAPPVEINPTLRVWKVPARNPHFIGRDQLLDQLHQRFGSTEPTLAVQTLFGLGGVGKSQLAIEYAHRFADQYKVVWWIDAEQPVLIQDQLISLAARLGLPIGGNPSDVVDRLLNKLVERSDWLLIFDNAERPDHIAGYRPAGAGHLLVTSRFPGWGGLGGRLPVEVMIRHETVRLLQVRIPEIDTAVADMLAAELGDLPLAAAQAAAYLEQTGLAPESYLRQFRNRRVALLATGDVVGYQGSLNTTWEISLERLRLMSPAAVELLELAAFLAPETVPLEMFLDHPGLLTGALREAAEGGPDTLSDAIGAAVAFSLIQRHTESFSMHRLVQAVIRQRQRVDRQDVIGSGIVRLLAACQPADPTDASNWPTYARLAPHVLATAEWGEEVSEGRDLMLRTVEYLNVRGDRRASRSIAETLLEHWREVLGTSHPSTLALAGIVTSVLAWLGEAVAARSLGQDTLNRSREALGADHLTTLSVATYLTSALAWLGETQQAAALGQETLERCRLTLGPDHPATLSSAAQWSFTLLGIGQIQPALALSKDTMQRSRRVLGPSHPTALIAASAVTFALAWLGESRPAETLGSDTSERCYQAFGVEHWLTLLAESSLGFALVGIGEYQRAVIVSTETVRRSEQVLGTDHWVTLIAAAALTSALVGAGDVEQASRVGKQTLARSSRALGDQHPITSKLLQQLDILSTGAADR